MSPFIGHEMKAQRGPGLCLRLCSSWVAEPGLGPVLSCVYLLHCGQSDVSKLTCVLWAPLRSPEGS